MGAHFIRALRIQSGLSQAELAAKAGIAQQHLSLIERNKTGVELKTLEAVLYALGHRLEAVPVLPGGGLPGSDLIAEGMKDLSQGLETVPSLLVSVGAPRLRRLGLAVAGPITEPELRLYNHLSLLGPDSAHSRYNALIRRLVSFERAAECAS